MNIDQQKISRLWQQYLQAGEVLPPLDRWLSYQLKKEKKSEQKMLAEALFDLLRLALLFCKGKAPVLASDYPQFLSHINLSSALNGMKKKNELDLWHSFPTWIQQQMLQRKKSSGWSEEEFKQFVQNHGKRGALWIRLNDEDKAPEILKEFKEKSFSVKVDEAHPETWEVAGETSLFDLNSRQQGLFAIQDLSSQGIGRALELWPGCYVWDVCAGNGGKTLLIASKLKNKGVLYATDIKPRALQENKLRCRRAGFSNVRLMEWSGESEFVLSKEIQKKKGFDAVLVDAPCSASGTWRKNPEAKFRLNADAAQTYPDLQKKLLSLAAMSVRPGGQLVYGTCSFFVSENEEVVAAFLRSHPHFKLQSSSMLGSPQQNSDSSFVAILKRD